jgi:uncharacterized protein (TIGR00730 family)
MSATEPHRGGLSRICVFCGSSPGALPAYAEAAVELGRTIASRGVGLVYGGGSVGIMGVIADAALRAGGEVIGVIPRALWEREVGHTALTELRVVGSMHERKSQMADLADAFVALPGGVGTLEEFFEIWTWAMLGLHRKPCGLLNVAGYYAPLLAFLDHSVEQGFVREAHRAIVLVDNDPRALLARLAEYQSPVTARWIDREET